MDFADLHGFWGEIWSARGGWGEKMRTNILGRTKKVLRKQRVN